MMYFDKFGRPIDVNEFVRLFEDLDYRIVASDEIPRTGINPSSRLSTVWLGINHNFFTASPPVVFETMRFSDEFAVTKDLFPGKRYHPSLNFPHPNDGELTDQVRYYTEEQASLGHKAIIQRIRETEMI